MISFLYLTLLRCLWCLWLAGGAPLQAMEAADDPEVHLLLQGLNPDHFIREEHFATGTAKFKYTLCQKPHLTKEQIFFPKKTQANKPPKASYKQEEELAIGYTEEEDLDYSSVSDTRCQVKNSSLWPHCVHGHLLMRFKPPTGGKSFISVGSGVLVGPNHVLTAGHNLFEHRRRVEWASDVWFSPGREGENFPFGCHKASHLLCSKEWIKEKKDNYDFGMVILDCAVGRESGWLGLFCAPDAYLQNHQIVVTGYPGDKGSNDYYSAHMWEKESRLEKFGDETIDYTIPTSEGQSGGAIWGKFILTSLEELGFYTIGIHTDGGSGQKNKGVRLTDDKFNRIVNWIRSYHLKEPIPLTLWNEGNSCYQQGKYKEAFECFYKAYKEIQETYIPDHILLKLADCYWQGKGIDENYLEAFKLYTQAEDYKNSSRILFRMGRYFLEGLGGDNDIIKGLQALEEAVKQNSIDAIRYLSDYNSKAEKTQDLVKAEEYRQLAEALGKPIFSPAPSACLNTSVGGRNKLTNARASKEEALNATPHHQPHVQNKGKEKKIDTDSEEEIVEDANIISAPEQPVDELPEAYKSTSFSSLENFTVSWKKIMAVLLIIMLVTPFGFIASLAFLPYADAPVFSSQMIERYHQTYIEDSYILQPLYASPPQDLMFYPNSSFTNTSGEKNISSYPPSSTSSIIPPNRPFKILLDKTFLNHTLNSWGRRNGSLISFDLPPFSHYPYFIESVPWGNNESYLLQLGNKLHAKKDFTSLMNDNFSQVALTGLGGAGKTSLALAYAYLAQKHHLYDVICWIKVVDRNFIINKYEELVKKLSKSAEPEREAGRVLSYLKDALDGKKVLWVYDNVSSKEDLRDLLPATGHIVITSRQRKEATPWLDSIVVKGFSPEESVEYLFKRIRKIEKNNNNIYVAETLAEKLHYFPLALAQAASYIQQTPNNFEEYIKLFDKYGSTMLGPNNKDQESDYSQTVTTTWKITMANVSQLSRNLMSFFAYLNADNIPVSLFKDSSVYRDKKIEIDKALMELFNYSMIEYNIPGRVSLHRLVQYVIQQEQEVEEDAQHSNKNSKQIIEELCNLFLERTEDLFEVNHDDPNSYQIVLEYFSHIIAVLEHAKHLNTEPQKVSLLRWVGRILLLNGQGIMELVTSLTVDPTNESIKEHLKQVLERGKNIFGNTKDKDSLEGFEEVQKIAKQGHHSVQGIIGNIFRDGYWIPVNYEKAIEWFTRAAEQGNAYAQNNLGFMYQEGEGVEQNYTKAIELYTKAAGQGNSHAQNNLGFMYQEGEGVEQNYTKAIELYTNAVGQGNSHAQNNLGFMYQEGEGVEQNYTKAIELYTKAAEQGNAYAQNNLGFMYQEGEGVEQNYTKAIELYTKAAEQGNVAGQYNLGRIYLNGRNGEQDFNKALYWFIKAAEQGQPHALYQIGLMYQKNLVPIKAQEPGAAYYFGKAAEKLMAESRYNQQASTQTILGDMYHYGQAVEKNLTKSIEYYEKATAQSYPLAQARLGRIYKEGWGTKQNLEKALSLIKKAADQKESEGQYNLALLYRDGEGVLSDDQEAVRLFHLAAQQYNVDAQYCLSWMYEQGRGVEKDLIQAQYWYKKGEKPHAEDAIYSLGRMYEYGLGVEKNFTEAIKYYEKAAALHNENARDKLEQLMLIENLKELNRMADMECILERGEMTL